MAAEGEWLAGEGAHIGGLVRRVTMEGVAVLRSDIQVTALAGGVLGGRAAGKERRAPGVVRAGHGGRGARVGGAGEGEEEQEGEARRSHGGRVGGTGLGG